MYNECAPFRHPSSYFSENEYAIADMGFQGDGANIITPFKKNQARHFQFRGQWNREIRRQRIRNEWSVGLVSNRFRLFLGRWPFEDTIFPTVYTVAVHLVNFRMRRNGIPPVPMERMLERLQLYEDEM